MKIITLVDNSCSKNNSNLACEHGLSVYIETQNRKILFDTGGSNLFIKNAKEMNIDLSQVDILIISHGHYDHLGGLIDFIQLNSIAKIYLKKEIFESGYYSIRADHKKYIGFPLELIQYKERFTFVENELFVDANVILIPTISQTYSLPKGNKLLFKSQNEQLKSDDFLHELIFLIENENDIYLFSGCAHNGLLNMLETSKKHFPDKEILVVHGGFHLIDANEFVKVETDEELEQIALELKTNFPSTKFYTGHCTGQNAMKIFKEKLDNQFDVFYSGHEIRIN